MIEVKLKDGTKEDIESAKTLVKKLKGKSI